MLFRSVLCFTGLHEVAREIESPFQNVPNDVPLNNYQAQFNEGLMVMFYGYHPDAYWNTSPYANNGNDIDAKSQIRKNTPHGRADNKRGKKDPSRSQDGLLGSVVLDDASSLTFSCQPTPPQQPRKKLPFQTPINQSIIDEEGSVESTPIKLLCAPMASSIGTGVGGTAKNDIEEESYCASVTFSNEVRKDNIFHVPGGLDMETSSDGSFRIVPTNDSRSGTVSESVSGIQFRVPNTASDSSAVFHVPHGEFDSSATFLNEEKGEELNNDIKINTSA